MSRATVVLPRLLAPVVGEKLRLGVEGETLEEAVEDLLRQAPGLRVHLFDESGALRPHVLCFVDGDGTSLADRSLPIAEGTEITFLQAVSGG